MLKNTIKVVADTLRATSGDFIASREKVPLSKVSGKHRFLSSYDCLWYSEANAQILGHNSTVIASKSTGSSPFLADIAENDVIEL